MQKDDISLSVTEEERGLIVNGLLHLRKLTEEGFPEGEINDLIFKIAAVPSGRHKEIDGR